jgi:hypothetical protein
VKQNKTGFQTLATVFMSRPGRRIICNFAGRCLAWVQFLESRSYLAILDHSLNIYIYIYWVFFYLVNLYCNNLIRINLLKVDLVHLRLRSENIFVSTTSRGSALSWALCPISFGSIVFKLGAKISVGHQVPGT